MWKTIVLSLVAGQEANPLRRQRVLSAGITMTQMAKNMVKIAIEIAIEENAKRDL